TGEKGYYMVNGHGDVTGITDTEDELINEYTYDIWGKPLEHSETIEQSFRYSGEYWDEETNLQYLRARWYDPSVGRFINEDTYEGELANPLTLNLYTYVHNNPLRYIDPSGNYCVSQDGKWAHGGECDSISSIYLGDDSSYDNRPIIKNGKVTGYINSSNKFRGSMNYWENYIEDKMVFLERKSGFTIDLYYGNAKSVPIYDEPLLLFQGALPKNAVKGMGKAILKQGVKEGAKALISKEIAALSVNNINHILKSKHLWSKVVKDPNNWGQVAAVMTKVMAKGAEGSYKQVFMKSMYVNNELVVVTYNKLADGTIKIGNAWVAK
ncbi:RHS repeat-associated core domain-containing protein, partial [Paenibacillus yanchengensis]